MNRNWSLARSQPGLGIMPLIVWACFALGAALYLLAVERRLPLTLAVPLSVAVPLPLLVVISAERLRSKRLTLREALLSTLLFLVVGYAVFNRTFGYIGIPQLNLFIGEVVLAAGLVMLPATLPAAVGRLAVRHPWLVATLLVWLAYGLVQALRGAASGFGVFEAVRQLSFHYYLLYLPLGLVAGSVPGSAARVFGALRVLIVLSATYGVVYLVFLFRFSDLLVPGTSNTSLFPQISAAGSSPTIISVLALVCLRDRIGFSPVAFWALLAANIAVLLGVQVRQDYVALVVSALTWAVLSRRHRLRPLFLSGLTILVLGAAAWATDLQIPSGRGPIGVRFVIARVVATVNPVAADRVTQGEAEETSDVASDNVTWRTRWWAAIADHVSASPGLLLIGEGYGFELRSLVNYVEPGVWTSHSVLFDTLGRLGAVGAALFALVFASLLVVIVRLARADPEHASFRLVVVAYAVGFYVGAHFYNGFGSPFGAIPLWILAGLALSPFGRLSPVAERPA